ncbi:MAG TPA: hypothetical protein VFW65_13970 [Pseudonocardiaceae bacterium]|nr:hypothetical protein [Pseudonocardiaceae bacterium]
MARTLRVLHLKICTKAGWQEPGYDLDAPVVAIVGPADTGKTSMLDSIAFALGADVQVWRGEVDRHLQEVQIDVRIGNRTYRLRRNRANRSFVVVTDEVGDVEGRFTTSPRSGHMTLSAWLLSELDLTSAFEATGGALDFHNAVLPFLYLNQDGIDRHIVLPPSQDAVRVAALKLLLGLSSPDYQAQIASLKKVDADIGTRERKARVIQDFLSRSQATTAAAVRAELAELGQSERAAADRLEQLKDTSNAAVVAVEQWQRRSSAARGDVDEGEEQLDRATKEQRTVADELNEVEQSLQALNVLEAADPGDRTTLSLVFAGECVECGANLLEDVPPPGRCRLCGRPLRGHRQLATRIQLQHQYQQLKDRMVEAEADVDRAQKAADDARRHLAEVLRAYEVYSRDAVAPHIAGIAAAAEELARLRQRGADLRQIESALAQLDHDRAELAASRARQRDRYAQLKERGVAAHRPDYVAESLNEIFADTLQDITLPNYTGRSSIDPNDLLPYVDGEPFASRGGGARVAVSVAYSLTLLKFALEDPQTAIPGLLMIDSPQKNLGRNDSDQGLARRVYNKFITSMQVRRTMDDGKYGQRPYQLVIVDNDRPSVEGVHRVHEFRYGDGFIKDLDVPSRNSTTQGELL